MQTATTMSFPNCQSGWEVVSHWSPWQWLIMLKNATRLSMNNDIHLSSDVNTCTCTALQKSTRLAQPSQLINTNLCCWLWRKIVELNNQKTMWNKAYSACVVWLDCPNKTKIVSERREKDWWTLSSRNASVSGCVVCQFPVWIYKRNRVTRTKVMLNKKFWLMV